jgi:hypothetical protein
MFVGLISGCSSVPPASPALKEQALSFKPPPGEGAVYIICPKYFLGWNALWDIRLDGEKISWLKPGTYLYTPVLPGEHALAAPDSEDNLNFFIGEGQNGFFTFGPRVSGNYVRLISNEVGKNYIRNYRLSGDDFYQSPFLPGVADSAMPVVCHIVLAQDDPFVAAQIDQSASLPAPDVASSVTPAQQGEEAGAGIGASFLTGFADGIAVGIANNAQAAKARKMSLPLQGHGLGQSFRTNLQFSLVAAIGRSPWLHATSIDITRENTNVTATEINQHPVMQIHLGYFLSPDASSLMVQAKLVYFRQGETNAAYDCLYTYISELLPVENNKAITQWSADNEALLHVQMDEGLSELLTMLDIDFFHRERMDPNKRSERLLFYDPFDETPIECYAFVMRDEGPRVIVQSRSGNMLSIIPNVVPHF